MNNTTELVFACFPVSDIARSRAFYEGLLELKPRTAFSQGGHSRVEYDVGAGRLVITNLVADPALRVSEPLAAVIEVPDLDAMVADLRDARVRFIVEPMLGSSGRFVIVCDPDGHPVALQPRVAA